MRVATATLLLLGLASPSGAADSPEGRGLTDYEAEIRQIDETIALARIDEPAKPWSGERLVHLRYRRASLTGNLDELEAVGHAIDDLLGRPGGPGDLYRLRAQLRFKFHRLADVRDDLAKAAWSGVGLRDAPLLADLDFQYGRMDEARRGYEDAVRHDPTWDNLARLAFFRTKTGDPDGADRLYAAAEDQLTAKEMRHFAWLELQRGLLALVRGRPEDAAVHYERAGRAYSGYWLIDEYKAECLASTRKFDAAVALYEKVLAQAPRPEIQQALGDLYAYMGRPEKAGPWHDRAIAAYLLSARRGEVHYYHHLVTYYADVLEDGPEAVKWARKDLELRPNPATREALAWALYRDGRFDEALAQVNKSLEAGLRDAHLCYHAAMIHLAAGRVEQGKQLLARTAALNPRYENFHVHR
jgi:tetratricopeptide (TPR) repeat protein